MRKKKFNKIKAQNNKDKEEAFLEGYKAGLLNKPKVIDFITSQMMDQWLAGWRKGEKERMRDKL